MRIRILILYNLLWLLPFMAASQSCIVFNAAGDTTLLCNTNCFTLKAKIPDVRSTERYSVIAAPYNPYPFVTAAPQLTLPCATNDDKFYQATTIPFDFCFYGEVCKKFVIATNGVISFDTTYALKCNGWDLTVSLNNPLKLPASGAGSCGSSNADCGTPNGIRYPRASIMGAYYDLDIDKTSANKKAEVRVEGTAPCRRVVVSYNQIPLFNCNTKYATQQIVLHEGSAMIDVYIQDKPICTSWNEDFAIVGIQNWDYTDATTPPNRNNTNGWGGTNINEAWRFVPSGSASRYKKVELYQGNTLIATGDTTILGNGELGVSFTNICPSQNITNYRIVAYYANCKDQNEETTAEGFVTVTKGKSLSISTMVMPGSCTNSGIGTITVSPFGNGYEYSIDGINWLINNVFSKPVGVYTIKVRHLAGGCLDSVQAIIPLAPPFTMAITAAAAKCYGAADGLVTINTAGGTAPFQFSANMGNSYQLSDTFRLAAGTYTIRVKDANNCTKDSSITITQPDSLGIATQINPAFCSGTADGKIIVTATNGTPGYTYALAGGSYQTNNVLLASVGSFTVMIKDANGCIKSLAGNVVPLSDTMRLAPMADTSLCLGSGLLLQPNTNANQFLWSPAAGLSSIMMANPTASPQDTVTYYLEAKLGTLCSRKDTFTINVLKPPIPFAGNDTTICYDTQAQLHASAIRGNTYSWTPITGLSNANLPNPFVTLLATTTYTVAVTDPYNCGFIRKDSVTIQVRPKVRAYAGQDTTATIGTPVQLFGCCMNLYRWSPSFIFQNDTARNPIGNFPAGTNPIIMLTTTPEGCSGKDTIIVKAYQGPDYYVPSGFSPGNRDGKNDRFRPIPVGIEETIFFNVYNRYGQLVFTTKTFLDGWDGTYNGLLQPEGAYVWMVKGRTIAGKIIEKKGTVMLIRN